MSGYNHAVRRKRYSELNEKNLLKAWIVFSEVYNLRRTNMSAVFGSYDENLENTSSLSDVSDVFRTHWCGVVFIWNFNREFGFQTGI